MKVIDDFLPSDQFQELQSLMLGNQFPWFFNDDILHEHNPNYNSNDYQFTHVFYNADPPWNGKASSLYSVLEPCLIKLGVRNLWRIKANLNPRTLFHRKGGYHRDVIPPITTSIFYINTNNGWTQFKKGGRVKSRANRLVSFDSELEHTGVTCTDEKVRVLINFNYEQL